MHSQAKSVTSALPPVLEIQPLTPEFYTNLLKYKNPELAFAAETESLPRISDPISQRLWVSNPRLLQQLIDTEGPSEDLQSCSSSTWKRKSESKSFLGDFIDSQCFLDQRITYRAARTHFLLAKNTAWGSYRLTAVYGFLLHIMIVQVVWKGLWRIHGDLVIVKGSEAFVVPIIFFFLLRAWDWLTSRFY